MALAWSGSCVRHGYSNIRRWKMSSSMEGSVRYQLWEWLWVFCPRPWFARKGHRSSNIGYSEQLASRSRFKLEGSFLMWIHRFSHSSASDAPEFHNNATNTNNITWNFDMGIGLSSFSPHTGQT